MFAPMFPQEFNIKPQAPKIVKSKFTPEEDKKLLSLVQNATDVDWSFIASQLPNRNPRQCRERWQNYLNPDLKAQIWTEEEDRLILERYNEMGPHWNAIGRTFVGRSGNAVRNRYLVLMRHQKKQKRSLKDYENFDFPEFIMPCDYTQQQAQQPINNMPQQFPVQQQFIPPPLTQSVQPQQQPELVPNNNFAPNYFNNAAPQQTLQERVDSAIESVFGNIDQIFQPCDDFDFIDSFFD